MKANSTGKSPPLTILGSAAVAAVAAVVLVLGPLVTVVGAISRGSRDVRDHVTVLGAAATVTAATIAMVVALAVAAVLALCARSLLRGESWARGALAAVTVVFGLFSVLGGPFDRTLETLAVPPLLVVALILAFVESSTRFLTGSHA